MAKGDSVNFPYENGERAAYHETAHAIVAHSLGSRVQSVRVTFDVNGDETGGMVELDRPDHDDGTEAKIGVAGAVSDIKLLTGSVDVAVASKLCSVFARLPTIQPDSWALACDSRLKVNGVSLGTCHNDALNLVRIGSKDLNEAVESVIDMLNDERTWRKVEALAARLLQQPLTSTTKGSEKVLCREAFVNVIEELEGLSPQIPTTPIPHPKPAQ